MSRLTYYHFDRRGELVPGWKKVFKNNRNLLNGFFTGLGMDITSSTRDFGIDLIKKVNDYALDETLSLDFSKDIISRIIETDNFKVKKVLYEFIFEQTRRNEYNEKPSRLKSVFVSQNIEDLEIWKNGSLGNERKSYKLTAINDKIDFSHEADAFWFEKCDFNNIIEAQIYAKKYWERTKQDNPKIELLLIGEFDCIEID